MSTTAQPISHGVALEALRSAKENLTFVCSVCPELDEKSLDQAIHVINGTSKRIFESYLQELGKDSAEGAGDLPVRRAA